MKATPKPGLRQTYVNLKKANWDRYRLDVEAVLSKRSLPTDCQRDEKILRTILLKAASHHISAGRHILHEEAVPAEILDVMTRRDDLRKRDHTLSELPRLNKDIQKRICEHKREHGQILPSCGELSKELTAEQNARQRTKLSFNGISFSSSKQLAVKFNKQFSTSKLGRHSSSRETRLVTRETKRKPMEMAKTFTADIITRAIKSCRNSKAFDPDKLSIFHLKNLGPRSTSPPSSTSLSPIVRSQLYGSLH